MKLLFSKVRETKNKVRFDEVLEKGTKIPVVGALYITKEVAKTSTKVEVDVTFID